MKTAQKIKSSFNAEKSTMMLCTCRIFPTTLFGLAFLSIVWEQELGIEQLTPWPVLGAALLMSIGLSLIFSGRKKSTHWESHYIPKDTNYDSGERIYWKTKFGGSEKHIDSPNLVSVDIETKCGGTEVYMDKATAAGDTVAVRVNCTCGGVELYIPRNWHVENQVNCIMGAVDIPAEGNEVNYVRIVLTGQVKLGGIDITRV